MAVRDFLSRIRFRPPAVSMLPEPPVPMHQCLGCGEWVTERAVRHHRIGTVTYGRVVKALYCDGREIIVAVNHERSP